MFANIRLRYTYESIDLDISTCFIYRLVDVTFICVMDRIGRDYNQTCRSSDKILAVDVFSPMFKAAFSLKYDPIECEYR